LVVLHYTEIAKHESYPDSSPSQQTTSSQPEHPSTPSQMHNGIASISLLRESDSSSAAVQVEIQAPTLSVLLSRGKKVDPTLGKVNFLMSSFARFFFSGYFSHSTYPCQPGSSSSNPRASGLGISSLFLNTKLG
jgi:hypothetical protein